MPPEAVLWQTVSITSENPTDAYRHLTESENPMHSTRPDIRAVWMAAAGVCLLSLVDFACAQEEEKKGPEPEVLVTNLENPCGLAVQPGTGHVFIASRYGVYRYMPKEHQVHLEISGYPTDVYGKGPMYDVGPLGLGFIDAEHLVVGDGSRPDGSELVRIYKIGAEPPESPIKEADAEHTLGPITAEQASPGNDAAKGEGNFYGVAVGGGAVFITCNGDDTKGWVAKFELNNGAPGELKTAIATKEKTMVDAPVPILFSPNGEDLVVGQMGEVNVPGDSLYTSYDPATGELKQNLKTGLSDIAGMAYSPSGKLYVTDFAWAEPTAGGLFRLDVSESEAKPEKIMSLDKPTALAFGSEGSLYITVFGTAEEGSDKSPGKLLVVKPGL
jgi:hypothetical protein